MRNRNKNKFTGDAWESDEKTWKEVADAYEELTTELENENKRLLALLEERGIVDVGEEEEGGGQRAVGAFAETYPDAIQYAVALTGLFDPQSRNVMSASTEIKMDEGFQGDFIDESRLYTTTALSLLKVSLRILKEAADGKEDAGSLAPFQAFVETTFLLDSVEECCNDLSREVCHHPVFERLLDELAGEIGNL